MSIIISKLKIIKMIKFIKKMRSKLLDLPKISKITISIFVDSILCILTTWLSFYLRLGEFFPINNNLIMGTAFRGLIPLHGLP